MLSDLLLHLPWLPLLVLMGMTVAGLLIGSRIVRHKRTVNACAAISTVTILGLTLYPDGDPSADVGCAVELPYISATSVESLANIILFIPVVFFVGLKIRRPALAFGFGVALSAIIEILQGTVLGIGRACDTGDLVTNSIGAAIGATLSYVAIRRTHRADRSAVRVQSDGEEKITAKE